MAEAIVTKLVNNFFWRKDGTEKGITFRSKPVNFAGINSKSFQPSSPVISLKDALKQAQKPLKLSKNLEQAAKTRHLVNTRKKGIQ